MSYYKTISVSEGKVLDFFHDSQNRRIFIFVDNGQINLLEDDQMVLHKTISLIWNDLISIHSINSSQFIGGFGNGNIQAIKIDKLNMAIESYKVFFYSNKKILMIRSLSVGDKDYIFFGTLDEHRQLLVWRSDKNYPVKVLNMDSDLLDVRSLLTKFCLSPSVGQRVIEVVFMTERAVLQSQEISVEPVILQNHMNRVNNFNSLLLHRALKVTGKEKDRRAFVLQTVARRDKFIAQLDSAKGPREAAGRGFPGALLWKTIFGVNYLNVREGILLDMLGIYKEQGPGKKKGLKIYDLGLLGLLEEDRAAVVSFSKSSLQ
jgi:hypothetical protein